MGYPWRAAARPMATLILLSVFCAVALGIADGMIEAFREHPTAFLTAATNLRNLGSYRSRFGRRGFNKFLIVGVRRHGRRVIIAAGTTGTVQSFGPQALSGMVRPATSRSGQLNSTTDMKPWLPFP